LKEGYGDTNYEQWPWEQMPNAANFQRTLLMHQMLHHKLPLLTLVPLQGFGDA